MLRLLATAVSLQPWRLQHGLNDSTVASKALSFARYSQHAWSMQRTKAPLYPHTGDASVSEHTLEPNFLYCGHMHAG